MKITILNYTGNESNWGCQATSRNIIKLLSKDKKDINFNFIELEYGETKYRKIVNKLRFKLIDVILKKTKLFTKILSLFHNLEDENIEKIDKCDLLILNGEGSLHGYNNELIKFVQYLAYAKSIHKKTAIINHSLQFDNANAKKYLEVLYKFSDINYFREELSLNNAKEINVKNSYLVPDAAFLNYEIDTSNINININIPKKYILASGSVVLKDNNLEYFELLIKLSMHFNLPVVFIASCDVDKNFKKLLKEQFEYIYLDDNDLDVDSVQKLIKDSEFFYSGRFHLNIFAATVGKIFIPFVSNTVKMQGFLNLIKYPIKEIDLKDLNVEEKFSEITNFLEELNNINNTLRDNSKDIVDKLYSKYKKLV